MVCVVCVLLTLAGTVVVRLGYGSIAMYRTFLIDFETGDIKGWLWYLGAHEDIQLAKRDDIEGIGFIQRIERTYANDRIGTTTLYCVELIADDRVLFTVDSFGMRGDAEELARKMSLLLQRPLINE